MSRFDHTKRCVLCLSGFAALLVLVEALSEVAVYSRLPDTQLRIACVVISCIIALIVPCCGWQGARDRNESLLGCFSGCNYFCGVLDCLAVGLGALVLLGGVALTRAAGACAPAKAEVSCDAEQKQTLLDLCDQVALSINASIVNASLTDARRRNITAEAHDLLSEEKCIDTAATFGFGLAAVGVATMVLRCLGTCFHCASGHLGGKLQQMLTQDPDRQIGSDSDSD